VLSHNECTSISSFEKGSIDFVTVWCYVCTANIPQRDIDNLCWYGNTGHRQRVSAILFEGNICGLSTYGLRITYLIKHCVLVRNYQFVCMLGYQSWWPYTLILTWVGLSTISLFNSMFNRIRGNLVYRIFITKTPKQNFSLETNNFSASQEIFHILWKPKACYRIHKSHPLVPILHQINQLHPPTPSCFLKIHFYYISPIYA
jgi:hypothetical protein